MSRGRAARRLATGLAAAVLTVAMPATTTAASGSTRTRSGRGFVLRPTDDFEGASQAEAVAVGTWRAAQSRLAVAEAQLAAANRQAVVAEDRLRQVDADHIRLAAARHVVEVQVLQTAHRADRARRRARHAAAVLYRNSGGGSVLPAFGTAGTRDQGTRQAEYVRTVGAGLAGRVDDLRVAEDDARAARRALVVRNRALDRAERTARDELGIVTARRATLSASVNDARTDAARVQQVLAQAQARKAEFERAAVANTAASSSVGQILATRSAGHAPGGAHLQFPAAGPVTSRFGMRMHPIFHTMRMHSGIDIGAGYGAPVHAAAAGTVVVAGVITGYGNAIVVDHGNGMATLYGHLSRFAVHRGVRVGVGQTIGAVGNTGNSTGPHLHFEVRINGAPVDPLPYL